MKYFEDYNLSLTQRLALLNRTVNVVIVQSPKAARHHGATSQGQSFNRVRQKGTFCKRLISQFFNCRTLWSKMEGSPVKRNSLLIWAILAFLFVTAYRVEAKMKELKIFSPAFQNNGMIPSKYTCDSMDVNPSLIIENIPPNAKSLALIVDDPDAPSGTWVHWVLWNIDPGEKEIKEGSIPKGGVQGINDFRKHTYGGPCPPSGTHRYYFKLYALDSDLNLKDNAKKADLEKAMRGHIIAQAQLIGLYKRR